MTTRVTWAAASACAALSLAIAGCSDESGSAQPVSTPAATTLTSTVIASASPTSAASAPTTTAAAQGIQPLVVPVSGSQGSTTYDVHLPQVSGGPEAVRQRFNSGMRATLDDLLKPASDTTITDGTLAHDERSRVTTITPNVVAGVAIYNWYGKGAAHPNNSVATITINANTAAPVLFSDVFTNPTAAAQELAAAVDRIDPQAAPTAPVVESFANWVPLPEGFHTYVPVAHALGDYLPVTVPWSEIAGQLKPGVQHMLAGS
ncbi:hypothetical protein AAFP30_24965 [Gordonia sp. CPCC 205515]|uniref:hypothetical protein n=1 Tax=Gordonia sp. CPCC 205515 TaxID=3140791 RepID=UPI003AF3BC1C